MKTNDLLVSIALCTYNGEQYLAEQLESLVNQSYRNLEIVVNDDRSSDRTWEILKSFADRDQRITIVKNEKNLGYVKNFEKAIYSCKGQYVALCDQDDVWDLNKIELMVNESKGRLLIYHDSELIDANGIKLKRLSDLMNMYQGASPLPFLFNNCVSGHSCLISNRLVSIVKQNGGFDARFYHDWWMAFIAANYGEIAYINQTLVKYRQHSQSNTDILNVKEKMATGVKYPDINIKWLKHCASVQGQHQAFIKRIIDLYEQSNWIASFQLMRLLSEHTDELLYFKKKDFWSKLNYLRKISFQKRKSN